MVVAFCWFYLCLVTQDLRSLAGNVPRLQIDLWQSVCGHGSYLYFLLLTPEAMNVRSAAAAWVAAFSAMNLSALRERCLEERCLGVAPISKYSTLAGGCRTEVMSMR